MEKLIQIIRSSKYGIHDISKTGLTVPNRLPRFNMPLELGLFMGAKHFGDPAQKAKRGLILDKEPYRYQQFCSDIAGQDIRAHANDPAKAMIAVRNWLQTALHGGTAKIPGGQRLLSLFESFQSELPHMCRGLGLHRTQLTFRDYAGVAAGWLRTNLEDG